MQGKKSVIVLAREAVAAMELSQHPGSLRELIRNGSLFTVSRGTTIKLLQENRLVSKVLITEGSMVGQEGWVPTWQTRSSLSADIVKSSPSLPVEQRGTEGVLSPRATKLVGSRTVSTLPKSNTAKETTGSGSTSAAAPLRSNQVLRLQGKKSVIVLGREAVAAVELSQHPGSLRKLIRNGFLFTVPRGTTIKLLQENRLVSKVLITEGSMVGQEGWAPTWQVSP